MTLARRTLELCAIPSVTGCEDRICSWMHDWALARFSTQAVKRLGNALVVCPSSTGVSVRHWFSTPSEQASTPSEQASTPSEQASTDGLQPATRRLRLGLFGHLDTVPPAPDQPVEIREQRVYGCGASDMKAGLAVMMTLLERWDRYDVELVGVFYDREEGPMAESGLPALLPQLPPLDLAVVLEPTANTLQLGCAGGVHARVHFHGRRAHSARPWQGDNAIYRALPLLERLRGRGRREVLVDGLTFYEVMTPTLAFTKNSPNVVPDVFTVNVNYRFAPGRSVAAVLDEIDETVAGEGLVEVVDVAPAGTVARSHPLIQRFIDRCGLVPEPKQAWTDVARLTEAGVPAVNFGPGDPAWAHQAGEFVAIEALDEGLRCLETMMVS